MSTNLSKKDLIISSLILVLLIAGIAFYFVTKDTGAVNLAEIANSEELAEMSNEDIIKAVMDGEEELNVDTLDEDTLLTDIEETLEVIDDDYEVIAE